MLTMFYDRSDGIRFKCQKSVFRIKLKYLTQCLPERFLNSSVITVEYSTANLNQRSFIL